MGRRSQERKEFLFDVFVTALEGGIGYWSECAVYHTKVTDFYAYIYDIEDADEESKPPRYRVDIDVIARGLGKVTRGEMNWGPAEALKQLRLADRTNGEDGDFDADGADAVVQAGLFGKVVYG